MNVLSVPFSLYVLRCACVTSQNNTLTYRPHVVAAAVVVVVVVVVVDNVFSFFLSFVRVTLLPKQLI